MSSHMGLTKSTIHPEKYIEIARLAKALGHPARIAIIQHIIDKNACICGDLVEEIGLSQATISQHLQALKKAEIIKGEIAGTSVCYCIDDRIIDTIKKRFIPFIDAIKTCC